MRSKQKEQRVSTAALRLQLQLYKFEYLHLKSMMSILRMVPVMKDLDQQKKRQYANMNINTR